MIESPLSGRAEAFANIALAKYWGKSARGDNLTAVPSLSMTLDGLRTRTEVVFDSARKGDEIWLDGQELSASGAARASALLSRLRARAGISMGARVESHNEFPTAAGLASSASGFAALAVAAAAALGLELPAAELSREARRASASAARSIFAGFVELAAEAESAAQLATPHHWALAMVVAVVDAGKKPTSSTLGMVHTQKTSPYYPAWVTAAHVAYAEVRTAILERDFERAALAMEHSTRLMHATMFTSRPPVLYLRGTTVELMHEVAARRALGSPEAYTMDAGPNVKVLTLAEHAEKTAGFLRNFPGVREVIVCRPGLGAAPLTLDGTLASAIRTEASRAEAARTDAVSTNAVPTDTSRAKEAS